MKRAPVWLAKRAVMAVHQMLLAEFGGSPGIRDEGLLDSALARPRNLRAYEAPDLVALAAAYAAGIVGNHPFIDGNKRTGFMAAYIFLDRNGQDLVASEADATMLTRSLAAGESSEPDVAAWLRQNVRGRQRRR
ncbi:MAG: type II toxin-antitoxin system death-on-curing family toxin [Candidatus Binatia bacterium]